MFEAKFQTFEDRAAGSDSPGRVKALRAELKRLKLDGFVVTSADRHQSEYVPPREQRLAWLTGFTGSAGVAWCWRTRPRCSSMAATRCRPRNRSTNRCSPSST